MITTGHWIGQYKYDKAIHQEMNGFERTNFEIEITKVDNNHFTGIVRDDLSTGGTEGIGEITGKISGNRIEFIKQMPVMTLLLDKDLPRKTLNKKHPKIYYRGTFSVDGLSIAGQWRFKIGLTWFGFIPVLLHPTKGTWTMSLKRKFKSR